MTFIYFLLWSSPLLVQNIPLNQASMAGSRRMAGRGRAQRPFGSKMTRLLLLRTQSRWEENLDSFRNLRQIVIPHGEQPGDSRGGTTTCRKFRNTYQPEDGRGVVDANVRKTKDSWFWLNQQLGGVIGRRHPRELEEISKATDQVWNLLSTFEKTWLGYKKSNSGKPYFEIVRCSKSTFHFLLSTKTCTQGK